MTPTPLYRALVAARRASLPHLMGRAVVVRAEVGGRSLPVFLTATHMAVGAYLGAGGPLLTPGAPAR